MLLRTATGGKRVSWSAWLVGVVL